MKCDRSRELMIDVLVEPFDEEDFRELEQHLEECESCATKAAEYNQLWQKLETVAVPQASPGGLERLQETVAKEFGNEVSTTPSLHSSIPAAGWIRHLAKAAMVILLVGLGLFLGMKADNDWSGQRHPLAKGESRYLLIMSAAQEDPELTQQMHNEMWVWVNELRRRGILESVVGLTDDPPIDLPLSGSLLDESIDGFVIIRAASHEEARRISLSSPNLNYGTSIEVRVMVDMTPKMP